MKMLSPHEASKPLREGKVGLVPTETVVGIVSSGDGLARIMEIKRRQPGKPVALLCRSTSEAFSLAVRVPPLAVKLAEKFWPGPLTIVLDSVHGGTVGVRVPSHAISLEVLAAFGAPLYATSANLSGEPPPAALGDVDLRVKKAVDFAVDGLAGSGEASAVVDLSRGQVRLLRPTEELTEEVLQQLEESTKR